MFVPFDPDGTAAAIVAVSLIGVRASAATPPMKIPEAEARRMIGVTDGTYVPGQHPLAVVDTTLG